MSAIEPSPQQAKDLLKKLPKGQPVVMLNLLKFKETAHNVDGSQESGESAYMRYTRNMAPLLERAGGKLVFAGDARHIFIGDPGVDWDRVIMVEYPSARDFIRLSSSEEYRRIHVDRERGLERTELIVTTRIELTGG